VVEMLNYLCLGYVPMLSTLKTLQLSYVTRNDDDSWVYMDIIPHILTPAHKECWLWWL